MVDVSLIYPPHATWRTLEKSIKDTIPPLGLLYIASYLRSRGFSVDILDLSTQRIRKSEFYSYLDEKSPRLIGFSVVSEGIDSAVQFADAVKEWNGTIPVVMGGPHPTFLDQETARLPSVDVVVRREGEHTMGQVCEYYLHKKGRLSDIRGITFDNTRNPSRPLIKELDSLPFPARDLIDLTKYSIPGSLVASRGCPGKCVYCAAAAMSGGVYRGRSALNIFQEISHMYHDIGINRMFIVDDTFTALPDRTYEFCKLVNENELSIKWYCESRVDVVSEKLLKTMYEAGCNKIQFGLESGDQRVLNAIRKGVTVDQIENAVRIASQIGMMVVCSFIVGHHADTHESIQKTLEFVQNLIDKYNIVGMVAINTPFPGTYLYKYPEKLGISFSQDLDEESFFVAPQIDTEHLSKEEIRNWYYKAVEMIMPQLKKYNTWKLKETKDVMQHMKKIQNTQEGN